MQSSIAVKRAVVSGEHSGQASQDAHIHRLFQQEYPTVVRHLVYLTGDRYLAEDLAQEAFGKLIDRGPTPDLTNPRAWLLTVASNLAYNTFRTDTRRSERESVSIVQPSGDPAEQVAVRDALSRIEPRDRAILLLRHAGFTYSEIADVVEIKASSVGTTLARAQRRFREEYGPLTSTTAEQGPVASPGSTAHQTTGE